MKKLVLLGFILLVALIGTYWWMQPRGRRPNLNDASARPQIETARLASDPSAKATDVVRSNTSGSDWNRFRGPNGTGTSADTNIPTQWSDSKNLAWKTKLPGMGGSSPVLSQKHVFVTAYSGYGEKLQTPGDPQQLKRHLICADRVNGDILWTRTLPSQHDEDAYQGMGLPEHGYATNTAVTDGATVFVFLGKSGVLAFDMTGEQLWQVSVGTASGNRGWGTAASLILYDDLVIVNASEESQSLRALEKSTGREVWNSATATLELCYSTPAIVQVDESRDDLVIAVPGEIWGMNPRTGKLTWFVQTALTENLSPSIIVDGTTVYAFGGYRSSGSLAVKVGGTGNVTDSNILWTSSSSSYVATPVLLNNRLHWIDDRGMYYCTDATTGELVHRARMTGLQGGGRPVYASPISINGKLYMQTRNSGCFVIEPGDALNVLSQNRFESDGSVFNATPAVDSGQLFLRSDQYLYCVSASP